MRTAQSFRIVCLTLFFTTNLANGQQDSILMMNGRSFTGEIGRTTGGIISIDYEKKSGKVKPIDFASYRVFSYVKEGKETTVYTQDELQGNFLNVIEAKNATMGMYDARIKMKPRYAFWSSFIINYSMVLFDTYRITSVFDIDSNITQSAGWFNSNLSIFPFLGPPLLAGVWAIPKFRVKTKRMIHKQFENDPHYYRGYNRISRQKRILYALRGGLVGFLAGTATYFIFR